MNDSIDLEEQLQRVINRSIIFGLKSAVRYLENLPAQQAHVQILKMICDLEDEIKTEAEATTQSGAV